MAIRKGQLTKTIPIAGGMQDDVPEFQQEHPTCAYIENGRFRKVNEIEKRLPDLALSTTGLPVSGDPLTLAEQGDSLLTLDTAGSVFTRDTAEGTDWVESSANTIPYVVTPAFQSNPAPGMGIIAAAQTDGLANDYRLIAWEERNPNQTKGSNSSTVELVVEARSLSGTLLARDRVDGRSPKAVILEGVPVIYYCDSAGLMWLVHRNGFAPDEVVHTSTTLTCELDHPEVAGLIANDADITYRDDLRVGWMQDGGEAGIFQVSVDTQNGSNGCILYKDGINVKFVKLDTDGTPLAAAVTVVSDVTSTIYTPLACAANVASAAGFLISKLDTAVSSSLSGDLLFEQWTITGAGTQLDSFEYALLNVGTDAPRAVNGSLIYDFWASSTYRYAATVTALRPEEHRSWHPASTSYVISGAVDIAVDDEFDNENIFRDHRLVSEVTVRSADSYAADLVFAMEQWVPSAQPWELTPSTDFATVPVLIKPTTTIVVATEFQNADEGYHVIATLGAGQNKGYNASSSEQSVHLNSAFTIGNDPYIVTRAVLQAEDIGFNMLAATANGDRFKLLFPGEGSAKVTQLVPALSLRSRAFGESTLFATGVPTQYDGAVYGEGGVFDQPEITYIDNVPADGDSATDADDSYSLAYERLSTTGGDTWQTFQVVVGFADHTGQLHRSAPSTPLWVRGLQADARAVDENQVELGCTLPLSTYKGAREYFLEVYMGIETAAPQLIGTKSIDVSTASNTTTSIVVQNSMLIPNNTNDDPVRSSEVLYTEGNVLPSDPWPAFTDFVITSNRMFALSSEIPGTIYYSKLFEENIAPEFSAALVISVGRNRELTGLGAIDDKVVVFSKDEIFAIYDTGPDNTGANGDFILDRLQSTVGCEDAESIVEVSDGLCFYSSVSQEFHLLSRDLQIHDIGKPVEDVGNAITDVKAAIVVPGEHEVRWYVTSAAQEEFGPTAGTTSPVRPPTPRYQNILPANPVLVYNYHYKKWCVFSGQAAQHAVLHANAATYIQSDFACYQADTSAWGTDTGNLLKIRLPWLRMNQLQSYGRLDEMLFLGKYLSAWTSDPCESGDVQVTLTYDYEESSAADTDVFRFRANKGELGTARMQFNVHPGRPKCQAVQIEIEEVATTAVEVWEPTYIPGRGFVISGVDLSYTPLSGTGSKTLSATSRK